MDICCVCQLIENNDRIVWKSITMPQHEMRSYEASATGNEEIHGEKDTEESEESEESDGKFAILLP